MTPLELPDEPRWVEAHGIAADPEAWRLPVGAGFAVGHDRMRLIVVAGDADASALVALAKRHPEHTVLVTSEDLGAALRGGGGRPVERALLHTLPAPDLLPELHGAVPLAGDPPPGALADEIAYARSRGVTVWTVYVDDTPASFAYVPWHSRRWFDVSVDTLPHARQLGLATIVASAMIRDEISRGRAPVWGADEGNVASLALARKLGFQAIDEIWVAAPRPPSSSP